MENGPFEGVQYLLFTMGIFHCYVSLPEGMLNSCRISLWSFHHQRHQSALPRARDFRSFYGIPAPSTSRIGERRPPTFPSNYFVKFLVINSSLILQIDDIIIPMIHDICLRFSDIILTHHRVVVSNMFYVHPYLGKIPMLTNIFQRG